MSTRAPAVPASDRSSRDGGGGIRSWKASPPTDLGSSSPARNLQLPVPVRHGAILFFGWVGLLGSSLPPAITEFPVPDAGADPVDIAVGPDGALWFTEQHADRIGRI